MRRWIIFLFSSSSLLCLDSFLMIPGLQLLTLIMMTDSDDDRFLPSDSILIPNDFNHVWMNLRPWMRWMDVLLIMFVRFGSSAECGSSPCREFNYREHFHCLDCNSRVFVKKEEMIRHFKWHKKRDESLQHGFMRYSPCDDCSEKFKNCAHNRKQTHYHCLKAGCDKVSRHATILPFPPSWSDPIFIITCSYFYRKSASPLTDLHQHFGCSDARKLPPKRLGDHARGLSEVQSHGGLSDRLVHLQGPANYSLSLVSTHRLMTRRWLIVCNKTVGGTVATSLSRTKLTWVSVFILFWLHNSSLIKHWLMDCNFVTLIIHDLMAWQRSTSLST